MILPKVIIALSLGVVLASNLKAKGNVPAKLVDEFEFVEDPSSEEDYKLGPLTSEQAIVDTSNSHDTDNSNSHRLDNLNSHGTDTSDSHGIDNSNYRGHNTLNSQLRFNAESERESENHQMFITDTLQNTEEPVSLGSITVDGVTFTFDELCRSMGVIGSTSTGITQKYSNKIEEFKISELVSKMFDLLDCQNFKTLMKTCSTTMPIIARVLILSVLDEHFKAAQNREVTQNLVEFLNIAGDHLVSAVHYNSYVKLLQFKVNDFGPNVSHFVTWEMTIIEESLKTEKGVREFKVNELLAGGKYEEALTMLTAPPLVTMNSEFVTVLTLITNFSAARHDFVKGLLRTGVLNPNLKTPKKKHIMFALASSNKNCNDIVKAFLMHCDCKPICRSKEKRSLSRVVKHNRALDKNVRTVLSSLLESDSKQDLDSINLNFL